MSKLKLALIALWKHLCGFFCTPNGHHYDGYLEHQTSRLRDEHFEKVYRYGHLGMM